MAKFAFEDILYNIKYKKPQTFDFDKLMGPGIYHLLYESDLQSLYNIATSIKYSGALKKKYAAINDILRPRGFTHFHRGTNRIVYKYYENPNILIKVPIDVAGCSDGKMEFKNQNLLKPFVTKVFDIHPSGVSVHERVMPFTTYAEFANFAYDYFQVVSHVFLGRFVMDDIGEGSFMNWGYRRGFGLVLLDFPYLYELVDYQRLICRKIDQSTGHVCGGEIDYDNGFNHLVCKKCGFTYNAKDIGRFIQNHDVNIIQKEGNDIMGRFARKMVLVRGNEVLKEFGTNHMESDVIVSKDRFQEVDRIRKQSQPKRVEKTFNIPKPPAFKFVPKKEEPKPEVVEEQIEKENEEVEQVQASYEEEQHEEKSEAEKFVEDMIEEDDGSKEYVTFNEDGTTTVKSQLDNPVEEDKAEAERFPEPEEVVNEVKEPVQEEQHNELEQKSEEDNSSELDALVHSLSVDEIEEKILKHFASLLTLGSKIQAIDDMLKPYVYQKFPNTATDVYLKYMNAVNRISQFIEGEKAKVMDPVQVQSSVEEKTIDIYDEYFPIIEGWFTSDLDPRGNLPNIETDTGFVSFDMICKGLKETASSFITGELDEKGYSLPEDFELIIDKIVQNAVNAHMDYIQKWADDVK